MQTSAAPRLAATVVASNSVKLSLARTLIDGSSGIRSLPCAACGWRKTSRLHNSRNFSTSPQSRIREIFPPPANAPNIRITPPAWHHPVYTEKEMNDIKVAHRQAKNWSDWIAISFMRFFRFGMDTATGYSHTTDESKQKGSYTSVSKLKAWLGPSPMTERKWLVRFLFLESVAGVPGMVAASVRHLHSLRRLRRDNGWIETLLEEAYNERMHLLTFMKLAEPGWFMKIMILGAQGVFYNGMFLSYLISPRICHRFVGHLEEEAVLTYTRVLEDLDNGRLPKWEQLEAPEIAVKYWAMPEGKRKMRDLLLYIRADEAKHREVNHTLANLEQVDDPNPFVSEYTDPSKPHPSKGIESIKSTGWERKDVL